MSTPLDRTLAAELDELRRTGQYKQANVLDAPQGPRTRMDGREVINLSSNNYLGLANHPRVVAAGRRALDEFGLGTASVRFICGTMRCHVELERRIAEFIGCQAATTYISCWDANVGIMPTLASTPDDAIFSDALNHASIIDAIRLSKARRFIFKHADYAELERMLESPEARGARNKLIVTDGVFSMEGDVADLPRLKELADRYEAALIIDESHATGVLGATGRGTAEHFGVLGEGTIQTSTLGKALGGACGGYVAGSQTVCDYLVQKSRPQLFSNALPPSVCYGSIAAIDVLTGTGDGAERGRRREPAARTDARSGGAAHGKGGPIPPARVGEVRPVAMPPFEQAGVTTPSYAVGPGVNPYKEGPGTGVPRGTGGGNEIYGEWIDGDHAGLSGAELLERLRGNVAHFRRGVAELGLRSIDGITPIVPVIVGETATAIAMQQALFERGVFVSGFGYPVVPRGEARLRCQVSAAHTRDDLDECLRALRKVADQFPASRA